MRRHAALAATLWAVAYIVLARSGVAADAGPGPAPAASHPHAAAARPHAAATARHGARKQGKKAADAGAPKDAATAQDAGARDAGSAAPHGALADQGSVTSSCIEHVPPGKDHPKLTEKLPARGISGHVATLTVTVEHGKGETVLPDGFHLQLGGDSEHALERAGFALPDPDGGAGPSMKTKVDGQRATTTIKIPLVPLPPKPGRQKLTLPPLPIAIARASGEVMTLCTAPHKITIDDPTASTPHAKPRGNPKPRRQMEEWTTARNITYAALIALLVGALVAWLLGRWLKRPKPVPPPPPPRPPWEVALEELFDIRHAGLIKEQRYSEHFDRVSHTVRKYLGDRYGFDGLESTTREILTFIRRVTPGVTVMPEIEIFLREADLVKFARLTPTENDCETALGRGEHIVHSTIPPLTTGPAKPAPGDAPSEPAEDEAGGNEPAAAAEPPSPYAPPEPGEPAAAAEPGEPAAAAGPGEPAAAPGEPAAAAGPGEPAAEPDKPAAVAEPDKPAAEPDKPAAVAEPRSPWAPPEPVEPAAKTGEEPAPDAASKRADKDKPPEDDEGGRT